MKRSIRSASIALLLLLGASCSDAEEPSIGGLGEVSADAVESDLQPSDVPSDGAEVVVPDVAGPQDAAADQPAVEDTSEPPPEPADPVVEACTELFPPLCDKAAECVLGPQISEFLGPVCEALVSGASGVIDGLCEQAAGVIPGADGFLGDIIAGFLFPTIQQCIEEFACTPENIAYFAEGLGSLAGLLGGQGGGGFDFGSVNELIDLFTDCDEPPPVEPEPGGADATDSDASEADVLVGDADDDAGPAPPEDADAGQADTGSETAEADADPSDIEGAEVAAEVAPDAAQTDGN